jgi:hypothetical protein
MAKINNTLPSITNESTSIHNELNGLNEGNYIHLTVEEKERLDNLNSFIDAPIDGNIYGRKDNTWEEINNTIPPLQDVLNTGKTAEFTNDYSGINIQIANEDIDGFSNFESFYFNNNSDNSFIESIKVQKSNLIADIISNLDYDTNEQISITKNIETPKEEGEFNNLVNIFNTNNLDSSVSYDIEIPTPTKSTNNPTIKIRFPQISISGNYNLVTENQIEDFVTETEIYSAISPLASDVINLNNLYQNLENDKFDTPTGNNTQYLDGAGVPTTFPTIPDTSDFVQKSDYTPAHSVLTQQSGTGNPTSVSIGTNQILGRLSGGGSNIKGLSVTEVQTLLNFDSKANITQVGNLLREEFTFSGSQTFTLANNYGQVYSVEVQGQGALSNTQYTLVSPNQITINDTLDSGDYVVILYSNAITGLQPYYSQSEVDALLNLKANSNQTPQTWSSALDGVTVANTLTITPTYTQLIPANTFAEGDVVEVLFRSTSPGAKTSASSNYIYINTSDNLIGTPIQVAIFTGSTTTRTIQIQRSLSIKSSTTKVINSISNLSTDTGSTAAMSNLTIDWTIDQYFIFAIGHTVADQTLTGDFFRIIKN